MDLKINYPNLKFSRFLTDLTWNSTFHFVFYFLCFAIYAAYLGMNWKEIAHFNDTPVYLFYIDYEKFFFVPHHRYVSIFTQYLPLVACLAGFSFTTFVKCYVLNGLLSTFILYLIYGIYTKNWQSGWIFLLCLTIGYKYSFYYGVPEHFGYTLSIFFILVYAHILKQSNSKKWFAFSIVVGIIMAGCHLFALIVLLIGFFYIFLIEPSMATKKSLLLHVAIFSFCYLCVKLNIPVSQYEVDRMKLVVNNFKYIETLDQSAFRYIFNRDHKESLDIHFLVFIASWLVIWKKEILIGIFFIGFYYLTFYVNCLYCYTWLGTEYMELYGRLIFFVLIIPLFLVVIKFNFNQSFFIIISIICLVTFYTKTSSVKLEYTKRYNSINNLMKYTKHNKIYIQSDSLCGSNIWFTWAIPHESLLISTLEGQPKTVYIYNGTNLLFKDAQNTFFNGFNEKFNKNDLKSTYYNLLDNSEYQFQEK